MKTHRSLYRVGAGAVFAGLLALSAPAEEDQPPVPAAAMAPSGTNAANVASAKNSAQKQRGAVISSAIQDILKMADAGVGTDVLIAYVESKAVAWAPNVSDILLLKQHSIPDEVTKALLKQAEEARKQGAEPQSPQIARAGVTANPNVASFDLDPDSYNYFEYYYLRPRAIASAQERLGWYPPPYSFGYFNGYPMGSYYHPGFGARRFFSPGFRR